MAETYSVVMTGKLAEGMAQEQVRANVGKLFKLGEEQLDKLFSGKPVAVRRNLDEQKAEKLCAALTKAGAIARVKSSRPLSTAKPATTKKASTAKAEEASRPQVAAAAKTKPAAAKTESAPAKQAAPKTPAPAKPSAKANPGEIECPRCGHQQAYATACSLCKMDLTLHLQRLERKERIRAFRKKASA